MTKRIPTLNFSLSNFITREIQFHKNQWNGYFQIRLPQDLTNNLLHLEGLTIGRKIDQPIHFPNFILDKNLPTPLLREFIGALFGGDGHTCHLTKHRGKRDLLTSISFSRSSLGSNIEYLETYINQLKELLERLGIDHPIEKIHSSEHLPYKAVYTAEMAAIIADVYDKDIKMVSNKF